MSKQEHAVEAPTSTEDVSARELTSSEPFEIPPESLGVGELVPLDKQITQKQWEAYHRDGQMFARAQQLGHHAVAPRHRWWHR